MSKKKKRHETARAGYLGYGAPYTGGYWGAMIGMTAQNPDAGCLSGAQFAGADNAGAVTSADGGTTSGAI